MIIKSIPLFGKPLFHWVTMPNLVNFHTPMPDDKAAFIFTLKGIGINYSEVEELKLQKNDAILAKCGNSTFKTLPLNNNETYSAISVQFHKDVLDKIYANTSVPFYKSKSTQATVNSVKLPVNKLLNQYINNLISYFDTPEELTESFLIHKLKEIILLLLDTENAPQVQGIMSNLFEVKTFEFKEVIKAHICSPLSIQDLANLTNMSLSSFKKTFKEVYNDTPNNYLINKRIEKVKTLILKSNAPLTHIAYDCEFKTLAHMSRVFKTKYGVSPSEYRLNFSDK